MRISFLTVQMLQRLRENQTNAQFNQGQARGAMMANNPRFAAQMQGMRNNPGMMAQMQKAAMAGNM